MDEEIRCKWCERVITEEEIANDYVIFVPGAFGYCYCSEECMNEHIESK